MVRSAVACKPGEVAARAAAEDCSLADAGQSDQPSNGSYETAQPRERLAGHGDNSKWTPTKQRAASVARNEFGINLWERTRLAKGA